MVEGPKPGGRSRAPGLPDPPPDVKEYLAALSAEQRAALEGLRARILTLVPDATETLSYRMPTVKLGGRSLMSYGAFSDHCSLFPMSMAVIGTYEKELAPFRASKGTIHFQPDKPLPAGLVKKLVLARVQELEKPRARPRGATRAKPGAKPTGRGRGASLTRPGRT